MSSQNPDSNRDNFGTPTWESREKEPLGCSLGGELQRILEYRKLDFNPIYHILKIFIHVQHHFPFDFEISIKPCGMKLLKKHMGLG
jgi:hypothetical protein